MNRSLGARVLVLSATLVGVPACADEAVSPAPSSVGAGSTVGAGGGSVPTPVPGRTVLQRNPFGHVSVSDNLLWDGDFEWLSSFTDQYGWLTGPSDTGIGYELPIQVIGAACKSGMKCIELPKGWLAVGLAVASQGHDLEASLAVAAEGDCASVEVVLFNLDGQDPDESIPFAETVDGWCRYRAIVPERKRAVALYVRNDTPGPIRVDDAVVRRAPVGMRARSALSSPSRDLSTLKREVRRRMKPSPRPRPEREMRFLRELERRRGR